MRTRTTAFVVWITLLSGCAPVPLERTAGARGSIRDRDTYQPIQNARICVEDATNRCVSSGADGKFDLAPLYKTEWVFVMIEYFPGAHKANFTVHADGYAEQSFHGGYGQRSLLIELAAVGR